MSDSLIRPAVVPIYRKLRFNVCSDSLKDVNLVSFRQTGGLCDGTTRRILFHSAVKYETAGNVLSFRAECGQEGEYTVSLCRTEDPKSIEVLAQMNVYALKKDLYPLRPLRGDFHLHSKESDGTEYPGFIPAACRSIGLDFMALTDHRKYEPSLSAMDAVRRGNIAIRAFPGEEIHLPDNPVHIVNFGSSFRVNEYANEDAERFQREVAEYEEALPDDPPMIRRQLARSEWAYDKIRSGGGIALFCHPYWRPGGQYHIGEKVIDRMLERKRFDAMEVLAGFHHHQMESNMLSLARYTEERGKGNFFPAVGVSDSHSCGPELFGWYSTLVFAPDDSFVSIADAIRRGRCVALRTLPGEMPLIAGPFRLVKYAYFLLREYFPAHDKLCAKDVTKETAPLWEEMVAPR